MNTQQQQEHALKFTGDGWEYFNIWIINLLLTIATFGFYSAWAKVRRLQYFYRNTRLADASFDYHGTPLAILKGRLIAGGLFLFYYMDGNLMLMILIAAAMPWLFVRSLRFKLHNTSYRGLRFAFAGNGNEAYKVFLLFPFLTFFSLILLAPFTHQRLKQYQHRNSRFGATSFNFEASASKFYVIYLNALGSMIIVGIVGGILFGILSPILFTAGKALLPELSPPALQFAGMALVSTLPYTIFLFAAAYLAANLYNLVWSSTTLGGHTFISRMKVRGYFWIKFTNLLGILVTLGLFIPFAAVRMMRYKLENMRMLASANLSDFVAGPEQLASATGQEITEMFDMDISL